MRRLRRDPVLGMLQGESVHLAPTRAGGSGESPQEDQTMRTTRLKFWTMDGYVYRSARGRFVFVLNGIPYDRAQDWAATPVKEGMGGGC